MLRGRARGAAVAFAASAGVATILAGAAPAPPAGAGVLLRAARLIDGRDAPVHAPRGGVVVAIEGERIAAIGGPELVTRYPDAEVIDLGPDSTLLPGLIDSHSHPLITGDDYQLDHLRRSSATKALLGLRAAQENLRAGWTTLRVAGDADAFHAVSDLRRAIGDGVFLGPRIAGAAHYLSVTGGGGDINFLAPEIEGRVAADGRIADGPDALRRAVREEIKYGSDWIKLLVTGAFMSAGDNPRDVQMSAEEVRATIDEASRRNVPVMAHAHATDGIKLALRAGVRSIEHGTFLDEEAIGLFLEKDAYLVPTMWIGDYYIEKGSPSGAQAKMVELSKKYRAEHFRGVRRAIERGVKIAVGSDFGGYGQDQNWREIACLVEAGMTPGEAIQAATRVGAELLGWADRLGTLEAGKLADLMAVEGDPLADLSRLGRPSFVMVGGRIARRSGETR